MNLKVHIFIRWFYINEITNESEFKQTSNKKHIKTKSTKQIPQNVFLFIFVFRVTLKNTNFTVRLFEKYTVLIIQTLKLKMIYIF